MSQTFNFFGLPPELRDMIYKMLIHQGSTELSTIARNRKEIHLMRFCINDSHEFKRMFASDVALRQTCRAIRQEFDTTIHRTSLIVCYQDRDAINDFQVGPALNKLPILFNDTIQRLTIEIVVDDKTITRPYDWLWLTKMKTLRAMLVKIHDYRRNPPVLTRDSYLLHGIIAHLLSHIAKRVVISWGEEAQAGVRRQAVQVAEMKAVEAMFLYLKGTRVLAATAQESD